MTCFPHAHCAHQRAISRQNAADPGNQYDDEFSNIGVCVIKGRITDARSTSPSGLSTS